MTHMDLAERQARQVEWTVFIKRGQRFGAILLGWISFIGIWFLLSRFVVGRVLLPDPVAIGIKMGDIIASGAFVRHFSSSIFKVFAGFGIAVLIGTPIGYFMGRTRYWKAFFHDPVMVAGSVPGITYAVMALVIFGISIEGPILAVALISMPYVAINVAEGIEGVDRKLVEMSRVYRRNERHILRHVLIPSIMPFAFAGVRLSFALAWKVEQLTEVFGSSGGVGFMIRKEFEDFSVTGVLAWVLLFIGFMLLIERFVLVELERYLFRWRGPQESETA
ncbi:MAG TPA: ABC transporter permease [Anaerolineae bacterium]